LTGAPRSSVILGNGIRDGRDHLYSLMGHNSTPSSFHNISLAETGQNLHSTQQEKWQQRKTVG